MGYTKLFWYTEERNWPRECQESISGHGIADLHGKCYFCGRKINAPVLKPDIRSFPVSELTISYNYFYDPDFDWPNTP